MGLDLKKNEKITKAITVVLAGVLILIVLMPVKNNSESNTVASVDEVGSDYYNQIADYYEEKLKNILEESYGEGTMEVMVQVSKENQDNMYGDSKEDFVVEGVLVVANVQDENAISEISFAVCALFDLPAHRVAVMNKN